MEFFRSGKMQKLIWQNANGDSVDLTRDPYGITSWEGFSSAELNIQTQKVPFCDGDVFLDALLEQRELSVTLAMNAKNDLEKRYRLRRELIKILNPKLGEGYLIYSNDYTEKRIKCVPQIPLFPTNNSNDSGSPKASLAWTACNPYWEDTEEKIIYLNAGQRTVVENEGDVPCSISLGLYSLYKKNISIDNFTNRKKIALKGEYNDNIRIETAQGRKNIESEKLLFKTSYTSRLCPKFLTYNEAERCIAGISAAENVFIKSNDGISWRFFLTTGTRPSVDMTWHGGLYVGIAGNKIVTSSDGIEWTERATYSDLKSCKYLESAGLFCVVGNDRTLVTSPDGITWTSRLESRNNIALNDVCCSDSLACAVGDYGLVYTSSDGIEWTERTSGTSNKLAHVTYGRETGFVADYCRSVDGERWEAVPIAENYPLSCFCFHEGSHSFIGGAYTYSRLRYSKDARKWKPAVVSVENLEIKNVYDFKSLGLLIALDVNGYVFISTDGMNWKRCPVFGSAFRVDKVEYVSSKKCFFALAENSFYKSDDGEKWTKLAEFSRKINDFTWIPSIDDDGRKFDMFIAVGDSVTEEVGYSTWQRGTLLLSPDGITWTGARLPDNVNFKNFTKIAWFSYEYVFSPDVIIIDSEGRFSIYNPYTSYGGAFYPLPDSPAVTAVTEYAGEGFLLGCDDGSFLLCHSGTQLQNSSHISGLSGKIWDVAYSKRLSIFIAVADFSILYSYDGSTWHSVADIYSYPRKIIIAEEINLIVVLCGNNSGTIYYSNDGVSWVTAREPATMYATTGAYSSYLNRFCACSNTTVGQLSTASFQKETNLIADMSADSDLTFALEVGSNEILVSDDRGSLSARLTFCQKYIGV